MKLNKQNLLSEYNELSYRFYKFYSHWFYVIKKVFVPWNKLRIRDIPNEYIDPDRLMFHAMFQCLVDYVELGQPFIPNEISKTAPKRYTDVSVMKQYLESQLTPEGLASYYGAWFSEEEKRQTDKEIIERTQINLEILYLYSWYKAKRYIFDDELILNTPYTSYDFLEKILSDEEKELNKNRKVLLTHKEYFEKEEEHDLVCDKMLERILAVRRSLWT